MVTTKCIKTLREENSRSLEKKQLFCQFESDSEFTVLK